MYFNCYFLAFHLAVKMDLVEVVCYLIHVFHLLYVKSATPAEALLHYSQMLYMVASPIYIHSIHSCKIAHISFTYGEVNIAESLQPSGCSQPLALKKIK